MTWFRTAVFFWCPDVVRDERMNLGLALLSPVGEFCQLRFLSLKEIKHLTTFYPKAEPPLDAGLVRSLMQGYAITTADKKELMTDRPLRFDHPHAFHALYGKSGELSSLQWRPGPMGLLRDHTPESELDYYYNRLIRREP